MRKFLLVPVLGAIVLILGTGNAQAQGPTLFSWQDTLSNSLGQVIPNATVIVLSGTVGGYAAVNATTQPGSPLATIYADPYGATQINQSTAPLNTAAGNGTFQFWAASGYYVVQAYGPGINGQITYGIALGGGDAVACPTCTQGDSGGPLIGQVPYATATNHIGPNPYHVWNNSSLVDTYLAIIPATSLANQNSPSVSFCANYWTGSASAQDCFSLFDNVSGMSPVFTITHTGASNPGLSWPGNLTVANDIMAAGMTVAGAGVNFLDSGPATFAGSGSGSAAVGVAAAAGTPCEIFWPQTSASAGESLTSAAPSGGGVGTCQTSWAFNPLATSFTTTAATSDDVTVSGMTSSGHCSLTPTNALASGLAAIPYVSAKTTNQITVTHSVTASATFDILCTPY